MSAESGQPRLRLDSPYSDDVTERARFESPLAPFVVSNDVVSIREWRSTDLDLVEEASSDELIPLITTVPTPYSRTAGESLGLVSDWAFAELPVVRLSLFIEKWNVASIQTATAAGFQREALLHNWELIDGEPRDMWSFVRLRELRDGFDATPRYRPPFSSLISEPYKPHHYPGVAGRQPIWLGRTESDCRPRGRSLRPRRRPVGRCPQILRFVVWR